MMGSQLKEQALRCQNSLVCWVSGETGDRPSTPLFSFLQEVFTLQCPPGGWASSGVCPLVNNCLVEKQAGVVGMAAGTLRAVNWEPSQWEINNDQSLEMVQL